MALSVQAGHVLIAMVILLIQLSSIFREAYPDAVVEDVQFSFNIQTLADLDERRRRAHEGKTTSEALMAKGGTMLYSV